MTVLLLRYTESLSGRRIATFIVEVPRHVWVHILTHRMLSRNACSVRAMSGKNLMSQSVYMPSSWPKASPGMQPSGEIVDPVRVEKVCVVWEEAYVEARRGFERLQDAGVHTEIAGRLLAPFMLVRGVITATEWDNFLSLRCAEDTQRETREVALEIRRLLRDTDPVVSDVHGPFIEGGYTEEALLSAVGQLARISRGIEHSRGIDHDVALARRLWADGHRSPFEHVCAASPGSHANLRGWVSLRTQAEDHGLQKALVYHVRHARLS